jgi:hypothetical protein
MGVSVVPFRGMYHLWNDVPECYINVLRSATCHDVQGQHNKTCLNAMYKKVKAHILSLEVSNLLGVLGVSLILSGRNVLATYQNISSFTCSCSLIIHLF